MCKVALTALTALTSQNNQEVYLMMKFKIDKPNVLRGFGKKLKQIPFATANAMNGTGKQIVTALQSEMRSVFHQPTRYTTNSLRLKYAKKTKLEAEVVFKDAAPGRVSAGDYLKPQIKGGDRVAKPFERWMQRAGLLRPGEMLVPGKDAPLDSYGNVRRGMYPQIMSQLRLGHDRYSWSTDSKRSKKNVSRSGKFFWADGHRGLPRGIYRRRGKRLALIFLAVGHARYSPIFDFDGVARRKANEVWRDEFAKALRNAFATAKR